MKTYMIPEQRDAPGREVSILGLGCSRIGSFSNPTPMSDVRATLESALEAGVTVFDTADIYGQGDSERELGRLLRSRRERGFVVTKVGKRFSARMRALAPLKPVLKPLLALRNGGAGQVADKREGHMAEDFTPAWLTQAVDRSLRRLAFEQVDGLLLHSPPAAAAADPKVAEVLAGMVASGKVARFGVSCDDIDCLRAALAMPGLSLLQLPLNLIDQANVSLLDLQRGRITIFAREVIRLQPELTAPYAVASAARRTDLDVVLAGASTPKHLAELALACT